MDAMADDTARDAQLRSGLLLALASAASFGLSGPVGRGLIDAGWSTGAIVLVRLGLAALVLAPLAARALRGRWATLKGNATLVLVYGAIPMAGVQFAYFSAVARMDVGPSLLIEYTSPAAVVGWLWLRHGERPRPLTLVGAALAAVGLVLVLDLVSGGGLALGGVLWALGAMVGVAVYFVLAGNDRSGLPSAALAGAGLGVGAVVLAALGATGLLPMHATRADPVYAGHAVAWWVPVAVLGAVTAGLAYATGIAASRRLGSRRASFVGLLEVVAGVLFAWLLLGQLPGPIQAVGGALILTGVLVVNLGERRPA
jgi:drug/metabolite transporter (DMT)-like permease